MPFVLRSPAIDKTPRFSAFSIYYKDDPHKPKRVFSDTEHPDMMLLNFRKQISDVDYSRKYQQKMSSTAYSRFFTPNQQRNPEEKISPERVTKITEKLYQVPKKSDFKHDLHGFRS